MKKNDLLVIENNNLSDEASKKLFHLEKKIEELQQLEKEFKEEAIKIMKENNIKKFSNGGVTVTYKEEFTSWRVDSNKLKEKYEDIYNEVRKLSTTKETVVISIDKPKETKKKGK